MTKQQKKIFDVFESYNKEETIIAFIDMIEHLIMLEELAFDDLNDRFYWTATGDTLGCLIEE